MATIKDVAAEAGLSVGTVSRILNNRGYISQSARTKAERAMAKLDYQPNQIARSLSRSSSTLIGVIVPLLSNPFFAELAGALEHHLGEAGYQMLLFVSDGEPEREEEILRECRRNRVAGIILASGNTDAVRFGSYDVPFITIECQKAAGNISIECDNFRGGYLAASHLHERGVRDPALIGGFQDRAMPGDDRVRGFSSFFLERGIEPVIQTAGKPAFHSQDYYCIISGILDSHPGIDGIFATSDVIAAEVLQTAARRGIRVPDDLLVIGFDGSVLSSLLSPSLTTIRQPVERMAEIAASMVGQRPDGAAMQIKVDVELVERESTSRHVNRLI